MGAPCRNAVFLRCISAKQSCQLLRDHIALFCGNFRIFRCFRMGNGCVRGFNKNWRQAEGNGYKLVNGKRRRRSTATKGENVLSPPPVQEVFGVKQFNSSVMDGYQPAMTSFKAQERA